ncbi:hypothetical protein [Nostoc sphaeroides]|nr:hypothetical protein [Nostoc sphaeroides]
MTVHEFSVNTQQSTVNGLECGIIYFLEFPNKNSPFPIREGE